MKVLHVITSLKTGGAEKLVVQMVTAMRKRGIIADVCVFNGEKTHFMEELETTGCTIYRLGTSYYNPSYIFKLSKIIKNYDIVHTHNSSPQLFAAIANVVITKKAHLITTEHNTDNRKRHFKCIHGVDRWMYSQYKTIICISEETAHNLKNYLGKKWLLKHGMGQIVTIPNGIDVQCFKNATPTIKKEEKWAIVMVAAFRPQKDHLTLLRAMKHLPDDFELWLVGDGEMRVQIENEIKRLCLEKRIHLFGNRTDVPGILKAADIVVLSSNWEGFGLAAVEGMAAGKPVIASDVDGLKQIVEGYGLIFERGNDVDLASQIKLLSIDSQMYNDVSKKCVERAQIFSIDKMMEQITARYFML